MHVRNIIVCLVIVAFLVIPVSAVSAKFMVSPTTGTAPLTVKLTDQSNGGTSWKWDMGDGMVVVISGTSDGSTSYTYREPGEYQVSLSVDGGYPKTRTVTVISSEPVTTATTSPTTEPTTIATTEPTTQPTTEVTTMATTEAPTEPTPTVSEPTMVPTAVTETYTPSTTTSPTTIPTPIPTTATPTTEPAPPQMNPSSDPTPEPTPAPTSSINPYETTHTEYGDVYVAPLEDKTVTITAPWVSQGGNAGKSIRLELFNTVYLIVWG